MTSTEVRTAKSFWHSDLPGEMSIPVARPRLQAADEIALNLKRIDNSRWYEGGGLHRHAAFATLPKDKTCNSDALADHIIGLLCWPDLLNEQIEQICNVVLSVSESSPS